MPTALELVYQYRQLVGKCEAGAGLSFDEIEALSAIEALFSRNDHSADNDLWACRRQFVREKVDLSGMLRGSKLSDQVQLINLGPGGVVCATAPYLDQGQRLELAIDDAELGLSYRFKAEVSWVREDGDDYVCGLKFVGAPLLVHYGPASVKADDADKKAAA